MVANHSRFVTIDNLLASLKETAADMHRGGLVTTSQDIYAVVGILTDIKNQLEVV